MDDRERSTKNRAAILDRLAELRETAGAEEAGDTDTELADEDELFPIEDYDELNEGEILPLLPELYDDELDVVEDRERSTKNRAAILDRLAEMREPGEPEEGEAIAEMPGDAEQDEELFPIAEYDELTESEILPLLPELYDDELDVVEDRERATKNRAAVLDGLADLRQGPGTTEVVIEPEGDWEVPDEGWAPQPEADDEDEDFFPIADYDRLRVPEIRSVLRELSQDELERVRDRELEGANRRMVLAAIYRELGVEAPTPARKAPARKAAAKKAPARKAAAKKAPARKATAKKAAARKAVAKKAPATKAPATKATAKKAPTKKTAAKKTAAKKAPAKKTAAKKTAAKKAPARKATGRRR